ncbi:Ribosomal RNA large subunit methyltransferase K/L [Bienertia sinuspersici]
MAGKKRSMSLDADMCGVPKEWDEALCPICMEHPHNAVLLLCTSHAKGCRSYICDTSYRHSNCLDRFRKLKPDSSTSPPDITPVPTNLQDSSLVSDPQLTSLFGTELPVLDRAHNLGNRITSSRSSDSADNVEREAIGTQTLEPDELAKKSSLQCPLCRGDVLAWTVVEDARNHLNMKPRCCTRDSCSFVGNYRELRRHARRDHPRVRPAEVEPSRQRAWSRFEHQTEHDDIVTAIRSAMPGAVVLGDYVIDYNDRTPVERERTSSDASGRLFTTLFLFQMLGSMHSLAGPRSRSRPWTRHRRLSGGSSRQRYHWGENLLGLQDEDGDGDDSFTDDDEVNMFDNEAEQGTSSTPRQRRRLNQSGAFAFKCLTSFGTQGSIYDHSSNVQSEHAVVNVGFLGQEQFKC